MGKQNDIKARDIPQWIAPELWEIIDAIDVIGGVNIVSALLRKAHRKTVWRWYNGQGKIDYANWYLINKERDKLEGNIG